MMNPRYVHVCVYESRIRSMDIAGASEFKSKRKGKHSNHTLAKTSQVYKCNSSGADPENFIEKIARELL